MGRNEKNVKKERCVGRLVPVLAIFMLASVVSYSAEAPDYENGEWKNVIESLHLNETQAADELLESVLTPEQNTEYRKWKIQRDREWEFHYLLEGFLLTDQQAVSIKAIVGEFRGNWERTLPGGTGSSERREEADSRFRSKIGGVDVGMGPTRNRQNAGVDTGIGRRGVADEALARSEQEKNERIYGILSSAQRNLAGRVFLMIRGERESRMKRFMILN